MDDHRTTDLLYGHLGEASYDPEEKSWSFSREPSQGCHFQLLLPLRECLPPSLFNPPTSTTKPSDVRYLQEKWLAKAVPDAAPASAMLPFIREQGKSLPSTKVASLLAVGMAARKDRDQSKTTQILAVAHGEAGHILRIIKPRKEYLGWGTLNGATLQLLNPAGSEETYWVGDGGAIQQIAFGTNSEGATSWLAVRKADSTTILRPVYGRYPIASTSKGLGPRYAPSCLNPNPILSLKSRTNGAGSHADVSFNPWYINQFAVLDEQGSWSIRTIEGLLRKNASAEARIWKSGHICDDLDEKESISMPYHADGWGRIMWAANLTTIIVCQRRRLSIFDVKARPKRLYSPSIVDTTSSDWIVEVKRSQLRPNQIFILTTSQIFWLQITAAGEQISEGDSYASARILLSCHHFLDEEDEFMKFELLADGDVSVAVLYSSKNPLVKIYRFSNVDEEFTSPSCTEESFIIPSTAANQHESYMDAVETLCIIPAALRPGYISSTDKTYLDQEYRFYQLFKLSVNLSLSYSMYATRAPTRGQPGKPTKHLNIPAPTFKVPKSLKLSSQLVTEDQFIVPDGLDENQYIIEGVNRNWHKYPENMQSFNQNKIFTSIDAERLYRIAFFEGVDQSTTRPSSPAQPHTMAEYTERAWNAIAEKRIHGIQGTNTVLELSGSSSVSDDIDEAAALLGTLTNSLLKEKENDPSIAVSILPLEPIIMRGEPNFSLNDAPYLSYIYDKMIESWVGCLPVNIPGQMRLAKERDVRAVAVEVCLASVVVTIRNKFARSLEPGRPLEMFDLSLPVRSKPNFASQESGPSQIVDTFEASYTMAPTTPLPTPAVPYREEEPETTELTEDPAISRLRSYALSIKSQPPLGAEVSAILDHWPAVPGVDPSTYSWEAACMANTKVWDQSGEEVNAISRRKEERRRQRTEIFGRRQRPNPDDDTSQLISFGSQPIPIKQKIMSSQGTDIGLPMSQPDRGVYGSRLAQKSSKKRRIKGF